MRVFKLAAIAAASAALVGCKTEFNADLPLSALQDEGVSSVPATVRLEVPGCNDYEDSRQPSDAVVKAQEMLPRIFPEAEFVECYSQNMNSWTEFSLQLPIDRDGDREAFASDDAFNLATSDASQLGLTAPPALIERLEQARKAEMMMPDFEYAFSFNITNDTGETFDTSVFSAWVDGFPVIAHNMQVPDGESFTLRLSDVSIDRAIQAGEADILVGLDQPSQ